MKEIHTLIQSFNQLSASLTDALIALKDNEEHIPFGRGVVYYTNKLKELNDNLNSIDGYSHAAEQLAKVYKYKISLSDYDGDADLKQYKAKKKKKKKKCSLCGGNHDDCITW